LVKISKHAKSTSVNSYTPFHCSVIAAINKLILNIQSLQQSTPVFISHNQSAPQDLAGGAIVKYQGQLQTEAFFSLPYHPHTEVSVSSIPFADPMLAKRWVIPKEMLPSAFDLPAGCAFATHCPRRTGFIYSEETTSTLPLAGGYQLTCDLSRDECEAVEAGNAIEVTAS